FDAKRTGRMIRSKKDDVSEVPRNQLQPAKNEGTHENVAQFRIGLNELQQMLAIDLDHFACFLCAHPNQNGAPKQSAHFTGELPRLKESHRSFGGPRRLDNLDLPGLD